MTGHNLCQGASSVTEPHSEVRRGRPGGLFASARRMVESLSRRRSRLASASAAIASVPLTRAGSPRSARGQVAPQLQFLFCWKGKEESRMMQPACFFTPDAGAFMALGASWLLVDTDTASIKTVPAAGRAGSRGSRLNEYRRLGASVDRRQS
eukprot:CAMPEP_0170360524 /NCGR_PEP_ID=MMETSP0117_2-20130122/3325_1 /TAXON_ID=400756 /ORGANISM="Durinskia baltica, Strain CSIRO CS-38" /LENGTH=151 /DNA_ID=CAMNT_0010614841 /DNA_START=83 /DNA_END=534 /DNA_ORIENTATION=-